MEASIQQVPGLLQVGGMIKDHHRVAFIRRQTGDILLAWALKGLSGTPGNRRVREEEGLEGREESTAKERDLRQRVPKSRDETVEG